jgi:flagellar hook-basal body complex protein FliE
MSPISNINLPITPANAQALSMPGTQPTGPGSSSFKSMLLDSIQQVNSMQVDANKAVENLFTGGDTN